MKRFDVVYDREVEADLASILAYLSAARDRTFAEAFVDRLITYCEALGQTPFRGTVRDEIRANIRIVGWRRTITVAFEVLEDEQRVAVLGIFYRGRDIASAIRARQE